MIRVEFKSGEMIKHLEPFAGLSDIATSHSSSFLKDNGAIVLSSTDADNFCIEVRRADTKRLYLALLDKVRELITGTDWDGLYENIGSDEFYDNEEFYSLESVVNFALLAHTIACERQRQEA